MTSPIALPISGFAHLHTVAGARRAVRRLTRRAAWAGCVALASTSSAMAATATGSVAPAAPTLAVGKSERTLTFNTAATKARRAALNLVVLTPPQTTTGPLQVSFVCTSGARTTPTAVRLTTKMPARTSPDTDDKDACPDVWLASDPTVRSGHAVVALRARLALAAPADNADGALLISLSGGKPLAVAISAAGPAYTVSPSPAKLTLTRGPFKGDDATTTIAAIGRGAGSARLGPAPPPATLHHGEQTATATLTWNTTERADEVVTKTAAPKLPDSVAEATVTISDPGHVGTYKGTIASDTASAHPISIPVEVNVRHHFGWLRLVVALSAALGGWATWYQGRRRRRELIAGALRDTVERYRKLRGTGAEEGAPGFALYVPRAYGSGDQLPRECGDVLPDDASLVLDVWCETKAAKSPAELDAAETRARAVNAEFRAWERVRHGARALRQALAAAKPDPASNITHQTLALLVATSVPPAGGPPSSAGRGSVVTC